MKLINKKQIRLIVFYVTLLLVWQLLVSLRLWPSYIFPSPAKVALTLADGFQDHSFWIGIMVSFKRLFLGFAVTMILGGVLGVLLFKVRILEETMGSLILGLQTLPSVCWFPLALMWFGLSEWAIIFVVIMGSLFSISMAINASLKNIPPIYIKVGRNMGVHGIKLLWDVIIPAALPSLMIGLRQSWAFAWRSLMAGELLFNSLGLGYLLNMGRELNDINRITAVMLVIMTIGIVVDKLIFGKWETRIRLRYGLKTV